MFSGVLTLSTKASSFGNTTWFRERTIQTYDFTLQQTPGKCFPHLTVPFAHTHKAVSLWSWKDSWLKTSTTTSLHFSPPSTARGNTKGIIFPLECFPPALTQLLLYNVATKHRNACRGTSARWTFCAAQKAREQAEMHCNFSYQYSQIRWK